MRFILVPLALCACSSLTKAKGPAWDAINREPCYQAAERLALERLDAECPGDVRSCEELDEIMDELEKNQAACP